MAEISKITLPNGENYDLKVYTNHIAPYESRIYESTDYYATAANQNESTWYFMSVRPDDWDTPWRVRFKLHTYCPDYLVCNSTTLSMITGRQNGISYMNFNEVTVTGHYYISVYPLQRAGFDAGYSYAIGNSILYASNYTNKNYYRTFEVDLIESQNCTVTLLDAPVKWSAWEGGNSTNYASLVNTNGYSRGLQETGDANDVNYQNRLYYSVYSIKAYSTGGRYTLTFTKNNNYVLPITATDNSISGGEKIYTTESFDPFGQIYYRNDSTVIAANENVANGTLYRQILVDARYSFTGVTNSASTSVIQATDPIYIACIIQEDGSAKLYQTPLATQIPLVENGLSYILLGFAYNSYQFELLLNHPVYQFKNGQIIKLNPYVDGTLIKNIPVNSSKIKSGNIVSFYDSKGNVPVDDLVVNIEPVQDLHGYDHPWPAGGGKNKIAYPFAVSGSVSLNGVTYTINNDGTITANGTASELSQIDLFTTAWENTLPLAAGTYTLSGTDQSDMVVLLSIKKDNVFYIEKAGRYNTPITFEIPDDGEYRARVIVRINKGGTVNNAVFKPMLAAGSTAQPFSPYSNICPISGWTGAKVTRTGKNLLDMDNVPKSMLNCYNAHGEAQNRIGCVIELPPGTYTVTAYPRADGGVYIYMNVVSEGNQFVSFDYLATSTGTNNSRTVTLTNGQKIYIFDQQASAPGETTKFNLRYFQLELGSTATAYKPYSGETYDITFPSEVGTVYGGTLDVTTGELVVDKAIADLGGLVWTYTTGDSYAGSPYFASGNVADKKAGSNNMICSQYAVGVNRGAIQDCIIAPWNSTNALSLACRDDRFTDAATFKAAMDGVQLVYELATPITYQLTPQEVATLLGNNNIWADTGDTTVKYISTTNGVYIPEASNNGPGLMSIQDKAKVDNINNHVIASKTQPLNQQTGDIWLVISSSS